MRYLVTTIRPIAEDTTGMLAFYALYVVTGSAAFATAVGLTIGIVQCLTHVVRRRPLPTLLMVGVLLTLILGGLTVVLNDPRFVMVKPTILYAILGTTMLPRGWVRRYVPAVSHDLLPQHTFERVGWAWAALMFVTAAINLVAVATLPSPRAAGVMAAWLIVSKLTLFTAQFAILSRRARRAYALRTLEGRGTLL